MAKNLIDGYDSLFADLDGVVYEGGNAIEHAIPTLMSIKKSGLPFF